MNKQALARFLCAPISVVCLQHAAIAEDHDKKFQLNLDAEYLIAGNYSVSYDALAGASLQYFLHQSDRWNHFVRGGFKQNIVDANSSGGSTINIYSLDIGSRYQFASLWNKNLYGEFSLGAAHSREEFSNQLIDRTTKDTFSETNIKAGLGLGMEFTRNLDGQLYLSQLGSKSSAAGFSLSYKF